VKRIPGVKGQAYCEKSRDTFHSCTAQVLTEMELVQAAEELKALQTPPFEIVTILRQLCVVPMAQEDKS